MITPIAVSWARTIKIRVYLLRMPFDTEYEKYQCSAGGISETPAYFIDKSFTKWDTSQQGCAETF